MTTCPNDVLVARAAAACARGHRQRSLVNELLAGPVQLSYREFGCEMYLVVGESGVSNASFKNLRRRLVDTGFVIKRDDMVLTMRYPVASCNT